MPLLFIAMQNSKTPLSIAERGFLRCLAEHFDRNYCKTLSRGASCASVRAFIFEVVDKIANKYIYLFRDLVV